MFNVFKKPIPENVLAVAREARKKDKRQREKSELFKQEQLKYINDRLDVARHYFLRDCNAASPSEYIDWLVGYIGTGGKISHVYNYESGRWDFLSLKKDAKITELYGASSVNIIVPKGINCDITGDIGHNNVFFMDGFKKASNVVPLFNDILI